MLNKFVVSVVAAAFLTAGAAVGAMAADKGPAEITLGAGGKKPAVFPHKAHQDRGIACATCHHGMSADGKQVAYTEGMTIQKCDACHNADKLAGKTMDIYKLDTFQGAGHGRCQECHKAEAAKDPSKENLKKCSTCHSQK